MNIAHCTVHVLYRRVQAFLPFQNHFRLEPQATRVYTNVFLSITVHYSVFVSSVLWKIMETLYKRIVELHLL